MSKIKWTYEKVLTEAKKYQTRSQFRKGNRNAYSAAYRFGWLDKVCPHARNLYKPSNYWTKDRLINKAKKFKSRSKFIEKYRGGYEAGRKMKILNEMFSHIEPIWSKDKVLNIALKYKHRSDFKKEDNKAYSAAIRHGWLDEVCSHMEYKSNKNKRYVYVFEFNEYNTAYIGLTYDLNIRENRHLNDLRSPIYKFLKKNKLNKKNYNLKEIGHYDPQEASEVEISLIEKYKKYGWVILNTSKGGTLGGNILKWTKEKVTEAALGYESKSDFSKYERGAYASAKKNGWFDDVTKHMISTNELKSKSAQKWTLEKVRKAALKYNYRYDFQLKSSNEYQAAVRHGWLDEICSHMWSKSKMEIEVKKYSNKKEFQRDNHKAYHLARISGWLNELFPNSI